MYFEWTDACGKAGWLPPEAAAEPVLIRSVGYIVKETPKYLSVSPGWDKENNHYMGFITVPKAWITKRRFLD